MKTFLTLAAATLALVASPAAAQSPISANGQLVVSYADLDLSPYAGQEVLRLRVRDTARSLCRALGEDRFSSGPLTPSCESEAIRDARSQMKHAVRMAFAGYNRTYYADLGALPYPY